MNQVLKRFDLKKGQKVHGWRFVDLAPNRETCNGIYGFFKCLSCGDIESRKISITLTGRTPKCGLCRKEDKLIIQVGDKIKNWTLIKYLREYKTGNTMGLFRCDCGREYPRSINSISSFRNNGGKHCSGCVPKRSNILTIMKLGDKKYFWKLVETVNDERAVFECSCGNKRTLPIHDVEYGYNRKCFDCREVKSLDPLFMRAGERIGKLELVHKLSIASGGEKGRGIFLCQCGQAHNLVIADIKAGKRFLCKCEVPETSIVPAKYGLDVGDELYGWKFIKPAPKKGDKRLYAMFECLGCGNEHQMALWRIKGGKAVKCAICRREERCPIKIGETVRGWTFIKFTRNLMHGKSTGIFRCKCGAEVERPIGAIVGGHSDKCVKCFAIPKNDFKKGDKINNWTFIELVDADVYHYSKNTKFHSVRKARWQCKCGAIHERHLKTIRGSNPNGKCNSCVGVKRVRKTKLKPKVEPKVESIGELWDIWFELAVQGRKDTNAKWRNAYVRFKKWAVKEGWEKGMKVYRTDTKELYSEQNCYIK